MERRFQRNPSIGLIGVLRCVRLEIPLAKSFSARLYASLRCLVFLGGEDEAREVRPFIEARLGR